MLYSIKLYHDSMFISVNKDWCLIKSIHFLSLLDFLILLHLDVTLYRYYLSILLTCEKNSECYMQHHMGYYHHLPIWWQLLFCLPPLYATYMFLSDKHWQRLFLHWRTSSWVRKTEVSNMSKNQTNLLGWYLNFALNHVISQMHTTQMSVGVMVLFCTLPQKGLN